ncbi:MAG TPA: hypothetical protein VN982_01730 [Candidatus Dormibacteraeota bacterium]|nr:hypothetical protein [Candidatus Dormibacteraeota bacterium]
MNPSTQNLSVQIVRFVDDRFPGWVECEFVDANGLRHVLKDKYPIFTTELLDATSSYPQLGCVSCEVLARWQDAQGRELVRVTITRPTESSEGLSEFVVAATQLSN